MVAQDTQDIVAIVGEARERPQDVAISADTQGEGRSSAPAAVTSEGTDLTTIRCCDPGHHQDQPRSGSPGRVSGRAVDSPAILAGLRHHTDLEDHRRSPLTDGSDEIVDGEQPPRREADRVQWRQT